jgi:hypothetical protein
MDLSNKSMALLLVAAIVISLGGTMISLNRLNEAGVTGLVGGSVNLTISSNASCTVSNNVSFGTAGQPGTAVNLSTERDNTGAGFSNCVTANCTGIEINNTGNVNLLVNFTSNVNATGLIVQQTGLDPTDFQYIVTNGTDSGGEPGCGGGSAQNWTWYNVSNSATPSNICSNLTFGDANDIVTMEFNVTLETDVISGTKTALLTINCGQN